MKYEREMMRRDLAAKCHVARGMTLRPQAAPLQQSTLFGAPTLPDDDLDVTCDHAVTEPQPSLFGGEDEVCVTCGETVGAASGTRTRLLDVKDR